jgi:tetratricopeptide (TPR) repeat protein
MRAILVRYLVVLGFFVAALASLDYWNFPLSPFNFLNRLHPIDLAVRIPGASQEAASSWLASEGGAEIVLQDKAGREVERRMTDPAGRLRLYLRTGSYLVLGSLAAEQDGGKVVFYDTRGPLGLEVTGRKLVGIVELVPSARAEALQLVAYLEALLRRGDFDRALAIAARLDGRQVIGYEKLAPRLGYIRQRLDEGVVQLRTLQQLGPQSYNSSILVLQRLEEIIQSLTRGAGPLTVSFGGERFDPARRRRSLLLARDAILAARLEVAEQALRARALIEALEEYHRALSDPELWRPGQEVPEETMRRVRAFEEARPELVGAVRGMLLADLAEAVARYEQGDLDEAQEGLRKVARALQNLRGELEMPDAVQSVTAYLGDIEAIVRARVLEKQERWMEVLTAYTAVQNVNGLVRQGIVEARSKQAQPSLTPQERPLAQGLPSDL